MSDRLKIIATTAVVVAIITTIGVLTAIWPWVLVAVMGTIAAVFIGVVIVGFIVELTDWRWDE